jgi:hypothetical protein
MNITGPTAASFPAALSTPLSASNSIPLPPPMAFGPSETASHRQANRLTARGIPSLNTAMRYKAIEDVGVYSAIRRPRPSQRQKRAEARAAAAGELPHTPDQLFARAHASIFEMDPEASHKQLREADTDLRQRWENIRRIDDIAWTPARPDAPRNPQDLAYAATLFEIFLQSNLPAETQTSISVAQLYLTSPPYTDVSQAMLSRIYRGVLRRGLHWIDLNSVRLTELSATGILQAVDRHRTGSESTRALLDDRLRRHRDVIVDEAALIYFYAASDPSRAARIDNDVDADVATMEIIRARYATALVNEWQDACLAGDLIPSSPVEPAHAVFWYDGMAVQNTCNLRFDQIVDALYGKPYIAELPVMRKLIDQANVERRLLGQPDGYISPSNREFLLRELHGDATAAPRYNTRTAGLNIGDVWLTYSELSAIVKQTMRNLALDTTYAAGTPLHAIATTVGRFGRMHGLSAQHNSDPQRLVQAFNALCVEWQHAPQFPVHPSIATAHYLARSSGVALIDTRRDRSDPAGTLLQLASALWPDQPLVDTNGARIEPSRFPRHSGRVLTGTSARANNPATVPNESLQIYDRERARIEKRAAQTANIIYGNTADLNHQLHGYLKQRLLSQAPMPAYRENALITRELRESFGMSDAALNTPRIFAETEAARYPSNPGIARTPLQEFLVRKTSNNRLMVTGSRIIDTAKVMHKIRSREAAALFDHPIVVAKSEEILRRQTLNYSPADVEWMRGTMVRHIMQTPSTMSIEDVSVFLAPLFMSPTIQRFVEAIGSGEPAQMIALLPFIVPLYDIEEGVRHGDARRTVDGLIHFGEDAVFTALGMGAETFMARQLARDVNMMAFARSRMSAPERAGIDTMRNMVAAIPEIPAQVASIEVPGSAPHVVSASVRDPFNVHSAAAIVEDGAEGRYVESMAAESTLTRQNKHLFPDAPPTAPHSETGITYQLKRSHGLMNGIAGVTPSELALRNTVLGFLDYWEEAVQVPDIRLRTLEPSVMFDDLFKSSNHPSMAMFKTFMLTAYRYSDTAAAIFNAALDRQQDFPGRCRITFDMPDAKVSGNSMTFLNGQDLTHAKYISPIGGIPFQQVRMWMHEAVHWLTRTSDPGPDLMETHRGATIYLTDKILSEYGAYPPLPPRIVYGQPLAHDIPFEMTLRNSQQRALRQNHEMTIAENRHLDPLIDAGRRFLPTMQVMGEPVAQRNTVLQFQAYARRLSSLGAVETKRNARFIFEQVAANFFSTSGTMVPRSLLRHLIIESETFRNLAVSWNLEYRAVAIDTNLKNFDHASKVDRRSRLSHYISHDGAHIWLNSRQLYYFSEADVMALPASRQFAGALIDLFLHSVIPTEMKLPLKNPFHERGLRVMLENKVMQEVGPESPDRICQALGLNQDAYLIEQSTVTRAAVSEDGFLKRESSAPAAAVSKRRGWGQAVMKRPYESSAISAMISAP